MLDSFMKLNICFHNMTDFQHSYIHTSESDNINKFLKIENLSVFLINIKSVSRQLLKKISIL